MPRVDDRARATGEVQGTQLFCTYLGSFSPSPLLCSPLSPLCIVVYNRILLSLPYRDSIKSKIGASSSDLER